jgi:broad specificity phosphatase PhoE
MLPGRSSPVRRYLLVRHAEPSGRGPEDGLSNVGRAQAAALARRIAGWEIDEAWCSDLPRARETAAILLEGRPTTAQRLAEALREVDMPPDVAALGPASAAHAGWERDTVAALAARLSSWLAGSAGPRRHEGTKEAAGRGDGETGGRGGAEDDVGLGLVPSRQVPDSTRGWQHRAAGDEPPPYAPTPNPQPRTPTVLVVSHAGPLRVLLCLLLDLPPDRHWAFRLGQAGLTIVERGDDMGTLTLLNDRCHLDRATGPYPETRRPPIG